MGVMEKEKEAILMGAEAVALEFEAERVKQLNALTIKLNTAHEYQKAGLMVKHKGILAAVDALRQGAVDLADEHARQRDQVKADMEELRVEMQLKIDNQAEEIARLCGVITEHEAKIAEREKVTKPEIDSIRADEVISTRAELLWLVQLMGLAMKTERVVS
jgi:hypothetical protein